MNKAVLIGRSARPIELKEAQSGLMFANICIAVNRRGREEGTDFIDCTAFGKTAEAAARYVEKGDRIGVSGRIQTGSYKKKDGSTQNTFKILVDDLDIIETRRDKAPEPAEDSDKLPWED